MARFLNAATIMTTTTPTALEIARRTGYAGIEARAERLLEDGDEVRAIAAIVQAHEVWSLNGVRLPLGPDGRLDHDQLAADLKPRLEICKSIAADYLLAVPPRLPGISEEHALDGIRQGLALARDQAVEAGVGVAFEFLGFADCPIRTPAAAARVIEGLDGVALVLDSCHWHASGSGDLDAFPIDRLAMVHLNDAPSKPPDQVEDADRVLPGLGVIQLKRLVSELCGHGFGGPWSLETFNPDYWEEDAAAVAQRGASALDTLVGQE